MLTTFLSSFLSCSFYFILSCLVSFTFLSLFTFFLPSFPYFLPSFFFCLLLSLPSFFPLLYSLPSFFSFHLFSTFIFFLSSNLYLLNLLLLLICTPFFPLLFPFFYFLPSFLASLLTFFHHFALPFCLHSFLLSFMFLLHFFLISFHLLCGKHLILYIF